MRISDWSSDVCSSDLGEPRRTADCHLIHVPPSPFQGSASQAVADTHPRVSSSTVRAAVSKTAGCRFESYLARHLRNVRKTRFTAHPPTNRANRAFRASSSRTHQASYPRHVRDVRARGAAVGG